MITRAKRIAGSIASVLVLCAAAAAQTLTVALPSLTAQRGDTVLIPVTIASLTANDSVRSCQFTFSYNRGVCSIIGVETAGTIAAGASVLFNASTATLAVASTSFLTGSGPLVRLRAVVLKEPSVWSTALQIQYGQFNEGRPALATTAGQLRILRLQVSPKAPQTIVVGTPFTFSATGDVFPPLQWRTSDTSVAVIAANGVLTGRAPGQIKVFVRDSIGLSDSTDLIPVNSQLLSQLTVSLHDTAKTQTLEFDMPVYVSDVTGLGLLSVQMKLTWNSGVLQALGVSTAGSMTAGWNAPAYTISAGAIELALAGAQPLAGAGKLFFIRFRVQPSVTYSTLIKFASVLFNESINASTVQGTFSPISAPVISVTPAARELVKGDVVGFAASGGTMPYTWSSSDSTVLSINASTGSARAVKRGTASVTARDALGFAASSGVFTVNDVGVVLPDTLVHTAMDPIDIPVRTGDLTGLGILSFQMNVGYAPRVLKFRGIVTTGTLSEPFSVTARDTLGVVRIAGAGTMPLGQPGTLLVLRFGAVPGTPVDTTIALALSSVMFNEPGSSTPTAKPFSGTLRMVTPPALRSSADSVNFGSVPSADSTYRRTLMLRNAGGYPLTVTGIALTGAAFSVTPPAPIQIPGKDSTAVQIQFRPSLDTRHTDTVRIASTGGSLAIPVKGTTAATPLLELSVTSIEYGSVTVGDSLPKRIVIRNRSSLVLTVSVFSTATPFFAPRKAAPFTVAANDSVPVTIYFKPNAVRAFRDTLVIVSDGGSGRVPLAGTGKIIDGARDAETLPQSFALEQNYPNPFNPSTTVGFTIPVRSRVRIEVVNALGQRLALLAEGDFGPGTHRIVWNADAASGVYLCRMEAFPSDGSSRPFTATRKMILLH